MINLYEPAENGVLKKCENCYYSTINPQLPSVANKEYICSKIVIELDIQTDYGIIEVPQNFMCKFHEWK